ncbi:hypothetical protein EYF80_058784 [Liparis tanakae]|uniref:Uncharacterized protein n=1 Tax=Liparis tanakae TaxID=230148 RepID=A0A4Z2ERR5_9TELE|nr:hypothetical protein EYF80_058784 [Liparis tanakae]
METLHHSTPLSARYEDAEQFLNAPSTRKDTQTVSTGQPAVWQPAGCSSPVIHLQRRASRQRWERRIPVSPPAGGGAAVMERALQQLLQEDGQG